MLRFLNSPMILMPAYGAQYTSREDMLAAWNNGTDFRIYGAGCYTSKRDITELENVSSTITLIDPITRVEVSI